MNNISDLYANTGKQGSINAVLYFFISPGMMCASLYRFYSWATNKNVICKILSKIVWRLSIFASGCHISPKCNIGPGINFPHATGIVIGDGVSIGGNATIYQNVTIGQSSGKYPKIGWNVTIYPGAVIVGGVEIGDGCIVGTNSFVNKNFKEGSVIVGTPARNLTKLS